MILDHLGCLLEVFLARSEAVLSRFDLRRVVCFTHAHNVQLFTFYVLAHRTPTGGKSQNKQILGHFGLRRPLALREILGAGRKRKTPIFRC